MRFLLRQSDLIAVHYVSYIFFLFYTTFFAGRTNLDGIHLPAAMNPNPAYDATANIFA